MRSDDGLKKLLDLMLSDSYSSGGMGFATLPQRDSYVEDRMDVRNQHVHKAYNLLDEDGWHVIDAHNHGLWVPEDVNPRTCLHKWLKICSICGQRYVWVEGS